MFLQLLLNPAVFLFFFLPPSPLLLQDPLPKCVAQLLHQQEEEEREAGRPERTRPPDRQETRWHRGQKQSREDQQEAETPTDREKGASPGVKGVCGKNITQGSNCEETWLLESRGGTTWTLECLCSRVSADAYMLRSLSNEYELMWTLGVERSVFPQYLPFEILCSTVYTFQSKAVFVAFFLKHVHAVLYLPTFSLNKRWILLMSVLVMQPHVTNCQRALCGIFLLAIV